MKQKRKWDLKNISVCLALHRKEGTLLTRRAILAYKTVLTKKDSSNYHGQVGTIVSEEYFLSFVLFLDA